MPLSRTTGLRRTGINRRSKKKRKHQDDDAKREYMREKRCEASSLVCGLFDSDYLGGWGYDARSIVIARQYQPGVPIPVRERCDPHHIATGSSRYDEPCNILSALRPAHDIIENRPIEGFVWCLWIKLENSALDIDRLSEIMRRPLRTYIPSLLEKGCLVDRSGWHEKTFAMLYDLSCHCN